MTIATILIVIALILAVLQSIGISSRVHLGWAAFACYMLAYLVSNFA